MVLDMERVGPNNGILVTKNYNGQTADNTSGHTLH